MYRFTMPDAGLSISEQADAIRMQLDQFEGSDTLRALLELVGAGIAGTVLLISGVFYAENDINSIKQLFREANRKILLCIFPLTFILVVLAPWVVKIYMPEHTNATDMAITTVRCYSLALPFVAFNEMYINYFQATGRTKMSGVISAISRIEYRHQDRSEDVQALRIHHNIPYEQRNNHDLIKSNDL